MNNLDYEELEAIKAILAKRVSALKPYDEVTFPSTRGYQNLHSNMLKNVGLESFGPIRTDEKGNYLLSEGMLIKLLLKRLTSET